MKLALLIFIVVTALGVGLVYLWRPAPIAAVFGAQRPWRRLGAAICVVMAAMFVLGVAYLDEYRTPRLGLVYWGLIGIMALWLGLLALKDLRYTYRQIERRRAGGAPQSDAAGAAPDRKGSKDEESGR